MCVLKLVFIIILSFYLSYGSKNNCISLKGSNVCPGFNDLFVSSTLSEFPDFHIKDINDFDRYMKKRIDKLLKEVLTSSSIFLKNTCLDAYFRYIHGSIKHEKELNKIGCARIVLQYENIPCNEEKVDLFKNIDGTQSKCARGCIEKKKLIQKCRIPNAQLTSFKVIEEFMDLVETSCKYNCFKRGNESDFKYPHFVGKVGLGPKIQKFHEPGEAGSTKSFIFSYTQKNNSFQKRDETDNPQSPSQGLKANQYTIECRVKSVRPGNAEPRTADSETAYLDTSSKELLIKSRAISDLMKNEYTCLQTYTAKLEDELDLKVGDKVKLYILFDDYWVIGKNNTTGVEGAFPLANLFPTHNNNVNTPIFDSKTNAVCSNLKSTKTKKKITVTNQRYSSLISKESQCKLDMEVDKNSNSKGDTVYDKQKVEKPLKSENEMYSTQAIYGNNKNSGDHQSLCIKKTSLCSSVNIKDERSCDIQQKGSLLNKEHSKNDPRNSKNVDECFRKESPKQTSIYDKKTKLLCVSSKKNGFIQVNGMKMKEVGGESTSITRNYIQKTYLSPTNYFYGNQLFRDNPIKPLNRDGLKIKVKSSRKLISSNINNRGENSILNKGETKNDGLFYIPRLKKTKSKKLLNKESKATNLDKNGCNVQSIDKAKGCDSV
ncbi:hypothetical protein BB560_000977 [Smittium megazygosporum]|uniref:SH3 domain-containing protein n=1 Tax=Smittium megazygosporum TaxID=133381 RepID=A0A2T9ZJ33_9FUNG|nr:hypothetical protein BB560_000977 [Smittium megazygosporum]